jgi:Ni/Fe-hydrogenase subunit HybB-like protein
MIIYFILWIIFIRVLRNLSLQEDHTDPDKIDSILKLFAKSELFSKILIFILAITFSLSAFDWIMSVDVHWYSTIFALKNLAAAFLHGVSIIALIIFILNKRGYFPFLNKYHLHDLSRYIFMLSIVWGYFWFAQFMIIWYGNIPEETIYYYVRWQEGWKVLFFMEIGLNWAVPFVVLLPVKSSRNKTAIIIVIALLIIGQYIDLFVQVIPGTTGLLRFGWIEAGLFVGFAGLFALVVATALGKAKIIPSNHPYLEESINHQFV